MSRTIASLVVIALLLTVAVPVIAGETAAPLSTADLKKTIGSDGKNTIVFFQNPQGGPCRAQNDVLQKLLKDRKNSFNMAPVSTMRQEDQRAFYEYGVRNLPQLVLVDKKGKIRQFFPPGIQSYEALSAALDAAK